MTALAELRVIAFPGAPNLPTFAAMEHGWFRRHGVEVSIELTISSLAQAERVAAGECDIACTAFDNVVAYSSGQGAPGVDPGYVVIMGATQLELSLVVDPAIDTHADLAGQSIALDALGTGFAFVLYEMLERAGVDHHSCHFVPVGATPQRWLSVKSGTHAATLTIEPFTSLARASGFRILDTSSRLFDSYQGGVVAARRAVLDERPGAVRGFIDGYLDGLAWMLEPSKRTAVADLLVHRMNLDPSAVQPVLDSVLSSESGLTPDAELLPDGMATVLALRSRYGPGGTSDGIEAFTDLRLWELAIESRRGGA
jgi:ABC-type nitrate/sulfonate/bicarbonate transport system substrate-binding protein